MRPEDDVAVKSVIVELPVWFAVNATFTAPEVPPDAVPIVGACGTDCGATADVAADAAEVPIAFVAVTVKVKDEVEAVGSPVTVKGDDDPVAVKLPVFDVTVYEVIGSFPSKDGAVNATDTDPLPYARPEPFTVGAPITGAFGTDFFEESVVPVFLALIAVIVPHNNTVFYIFTLRIYIRI